MNGITKRLTVMALASSAWVCSTGPARAQSKVFTLNADFDSGTLQDVCHGGPGLTFNDCADYKNSDELVLGRTFVSKAGVVWADNYLMGWVVGMDAKTGKQLRRFDSGLVTINGQPTGAQPSIFGDAAHGPDNSNKYYCDFATKGNCPGRVTTDTNGDVWICNRAFSQQGTIVKLSGTLEHCIDRNGNGKIDTSSDVNGDGTVDVEDPLEYFGQNDECILATISVGAFGALPRSIAVDKKGKIWTATFNEQKVYRFNPNDPVMLEAVYDLPGKGLGSARPYSMASGGDYMFISNQAAGGTIRMNINDGTTDTAPCPPTYGIVAEPNGQVAWLGNLSSPVIHRADFTNHTCQTYGAPAVTTAITLADDPNPPDPAHPFIVWASVYGGATLAKYAINGTLLATFPTASNPHGESPDFAGNIWTITDAAPYIQVTDSNGVKPASITAPVTLALLQSKYGATPYLYSDFTGVQIDRQAPYRRIGQWSATYDGGSPGVPWKSVTWNTEAQGSVPPETSLLVKVRAADSKAALGTAGFSLVPSSGAALSGVVGQFVEVSAALAGPGYATVVLSDVGVHGPCDVKGDACCLVDSDCPQNDLCDAPTCPAVGGACVHGLKPNCCLKNTDCDDGSVCTADTCPVPGGACNHAATPGCCDTNAQCDDMLPCTADICSGPGGSCSHKTIDGCCVTDADCTKGNMCSASTCPGPGMLCDFASKPGCCETDADCKGTDLCELTACDKTTKACQKAVKVPGCCNVDADCADTDPCTNDACTGPGGTCKHDVKPSCCSAMSPDVGKPCDVPQAPFDQAPCKPGKFVCVASMLKCDGAVTPSPEVCDGKDNNCDGKSDNGSGICPSGMTCALGVCGSPCGTGENPCQGGLQCVMGACVPTDCSKLNCPDGTVCKSGACIGGAGGNGGGSGVGGGTSSAGGTTGTGAGGTSTSAGGTTASAGGMSTSAGGSATSTGGSKATGGAGGTAAATTAGGDSSASSADSGQKGACGCELPGERDRERNRNGAAALLLLGAAFMIRRRRAV